MIPGGRTNFAMCNRREATVRADFLRTSRLWGVLAATGIILLGLAPTPARSQGAGEPGASGSNVGYIDSALTGDLFRLRFDASYRDRQPTRAEFFWPKSGSIGGPGPRKAETSVDYQDISAYLELAGNSWLSAFVETPVRFLNPDRNPNTAGFADMNAGFKASFVQTANTVATFQFRTYIPTGAGGHGLGNNHVSLEPALLMNQRLAERWTLEGEFRYFVPIGGTDFAGNIVRYGLGLSYGTHSPDSFWLNPVAEFVGWTVLDGKVSQPSAPLGRDASGDTIFNAKLGVRAGHGDRYDLYAGYGRALTGDFWYKDTFRVEFRFRF
jgi:hypothetical protein